MPLLELDLCFPLQAMAGGVGDASQRVLRAQGHVHAMNLHWVVG